jgi:HD-GYP domain-containing protein (c-di-GMP phosphodiesterase class II)
MIKQIPASKLKVGMHVHDLDCSWLQHPFVRNSFKIISDEQIQQILDAKITKLYIDTEKGFDATTSKKEPPKAKQVAEANVTYIADAQQEESGKTPLNIELKRAANIRKAALQAVANIFEDIREGRPISLDMASMIVDDMVTSVISNSDALLGLTRIRKVDKYTLEHSVGVSILLITFGKYIGLTREELVDIGIGGLLHDIGKALTPPNILNKPGRLSPNEYNIIQKHVGFSQDLASELNDLSEVALQVVTEHHERIDGSGYPHKIIGDNISLYGQMAAIVDFYDAITTDRVYCEAISQSAALKKLIDWGKEQFNQELVQRFIHCIGIYPIGLLVALSNGEFAVVIESSQQGLLLPKVRIIFNSVERRYIEVRDLDLANQPDSNPITIVSTVDAKKWRIRPEEFMDYASY